jgi:hypothetical protein
LKIAFLEAKNTVTTKKATQPHASTRTTGFVRGRTCLRGLVGRVTVSCFCPGL